MNMKKFSSHQIVPRQLPTSEEPASRIKHFGEFVKAATDELSESQASRCMDCGVPFCHSACPLGNHIPDFNEAVRLGDYRRAYHILSQTNNFPEFTGRICPAPCEASCVLNLHEDAVTIEAMEKKIIETAYEEGWVRSAEVEQPSGKRIAIIGSGPAGLAAADQLVEKGHAVIVYEKSDRLGGLLRYGIPDFKLEKEVIDRRLEVMRRKGVEFRCGVTVGQDLEIQDLVDGHDATIICTGSSVARDLEIPGRNLIGVHMAIEYLEQANRIVSNDSVSAAERIRVKDQQVVVIGGGDTGSDCIGTSHRLGASRVTQIEILAQPPAHRSENNPWPQWPMTLRTSSSQEEGCEREWAIMTKAFVSDDGTHLSGMRIVDVQWERNEEGKLIMQELPDSERVIPCTKVFLALGFLHTNSEELGAKDRLSLDERNHIQAHEYHTSLESVFVAGDARRGQSLVVWAIAEGRMAAERVDAYVKDQDKMHRLSA